MSNKKTRKTILIASVLGAHVISLLIMWWVLNSEVIIEPEFEKIISVKLTNTPSKPLPPINQTARDKIAAEKKAAEVKKEQAAKARKSKLKKEKERRAAEIKKAKEKTKKTKPEKTKPKKDKPKKIKPKKRKPKESLKDKLKKERDAKAAKDKLKRIRDAKVKRANDAKAAKNARIKKERNAKAAKAAYKKQQTAFGQHIYQGVKDQIGKEWKQLSFAINFNTNDEVTISITIRKDGSVANARINGKSQNSQAQKLIAILNSGNYKFTAFPSNYAQRTRTFTWTFGAKLQE